VESCAFHGDCRQRKNNVDPMLRSSKNTFRISALVVALGLGAAACSGSDTSADSGDEENQAADVSDDTGADDANDADDAEDADGADADAPDGGEENSGGALTEDNFFDATSAAQLEAGSAHMVMTQDGQEMLTADISLDADPSNAGFEGSMENEGITMEIRQVDGDMYIQMGEMTDGKWMIIDAGGDLLGDTDFIEQLDPTVQSERLKDAIVGFEAEEDAETIDGVSTTKYIITLDTEKVTGDSDYLDGQLTDALGDEIVYEMYVGEDDLVRRQVMDMAGSTQEIDYSNWGEPVTVEAPSEDETITMEEVQEALAG